MTDLNRPQSPATIDPSLRVLQHENPLPPQLERDTIVRLRAAHLLRDTGQRQRWAWAASLLLACGLGYVAGQWQRPSDPFPGATHAFLVSRMPVTGAQAGEQRALYRQWAGELARGGHWIDGFEMANVAPSTTAIAASVRPDAPIAGLFLVRADSDSEALRLASGAPHSRPGRLLYVQRIVQ